MPGVTYTAEWTPETWGLWTAKITRAVRLDPEWDGWDEGSSIGAWRWLLHLEGRDEKARPLREVVWEPYRITPSRGPGLLRRAIALQLRPEPPDEGVGAQRCRGPYCNCGLYMRTDAWINGAAYPWPRGSYVEVPDVPTEL